MTQAPQVPIEVDDETGRWSTDGLPMVYVPVHFLLNNHRAIENEIGARRYAQILYTAGYESAWTWCEAEASTHGLVGEDVFRHYLDRLSKRGWAKFTVRHLDPVELRATIEVRNSIFAEDSQEESHDYMFTGWFAGAMDQITGERGLAMCRQVRGETKEAEGLFEVARRVQ
ncbi:DUF5943 domain-containing protein [Brevibacterium zhoupengii]|uniref:DUF5943 domain-containing protein n=1 Tax=Brevibacterium zhoupengii TaxID=2898795 RepID=UPI001F091C17|nr:DUF5943 domain-containing protein [Brevibacterium zhoupengii]